MQSVNNFRKIKAKLMQAKEDKEPILIENGELNAGHADVVTLDYVGERWCKGYALVEDDGLLVKIPYTIPYTDLYVRKDQSKLRITFKGE